MTGLESTRLPTYLQKNMNVYFSFNRLNRQNVENVTIEEDFYNQPESPRFNEFDLGNLDVEIAEETERQPDSVSGLDEDDFDFSGKIFNPGNIFFGIFLPSFSESLKDENLEIAYQRYAHRHRRNLSYEID